MATLFFRHPDLLQRFSIFLPEQESMADVGVPGMAGPPPLLPVYRNRGVSCIWQALAGAALGLGR